MHLVLFSSIKLVFLSIAYRTWWSGRIQWRSMEIYAWFIPPFSIAKKNIWFHAFDTFNRRHTHELLSKIPFSRAVSVYMVFTFTSIKTWHTVNRHSPLHVTCLLSIRPNFTILDSETAANPSSTWNTHGTWEIRNLWWTHWITYRSIEYQMRYTHQYHTECVCVCFFKGNEKNKPIIYALKSNISSGIFHKWIKTNE